MIKITGLWKSKTKKDGTIYYSGTSGTVKYLLFPVKDKQTGKPDLELYIDSNTKSKTKQSEETEDLFNE